MKIKFYDNCNLPKKLESILNTKKLQRFTNKIIFQILFGKVSIKFVWLKFASDVVCTLPPGQQGQGFVCLRTRFPWRGQGWPGQWFSQLALLSFGKHIFVNKFIFQPSCSKMIKFGHYNIIVILIWVIFAFCFTKQMLN